MAVTNENNKVQYNCDGTQTQFTFSFPIFSADDLIVIVTNDKGEDTTLTKDVDYTVSPNSPFGDYSTGGYIETDETYPEDYRITIKREVSLTQETDFRNYDILPAETLEDQLDKIVMALQQLEEKISRIISLTEGTTYSNLTLPDPEANKYLAWKQDLTGLKNVSIQSQGDLTVSSFIENLLDDADATEARSTLEALYDADDAVKAEHIDGLTGTGSVSLDNIPDGANYVKLSKTSQEIDGLKTFNDGANGNFNLVQKYVVMGSDVTNIDITGLNIQEAGFYRLILLPYFDGSYAIRIKLFINGNYTESYYTSQSLRHDGSNVTTNVSTGDATIGYITNNSLDVPYYLLEGILAMSNHGTAKKATGIFHSNGGNVYYEGRTYNWFSTSTITNITSIRLSTYDTNTSSYVAGFKVGTVLYLFKGGIF